MQGVSKESMQNLGCGGYLIYKTIQPNSLHSNQFKVNQNFQETNLQLFLTKKFQEMRNQLNIKKIPKQLLQSACLRVKNKELSEYSEKKTFTPSRKKSSHTEIIKGINQQCYKILQPNCLENQLQNAMFLDQNSKDLAEKIQKLNILGDVINNDDGVKKKLAIGKKIVNFEKIISNLIHQKISNSLLRKWYNKFQFMKNNQRLQIMKQDKSIKKCNLQAFQTKINQVFAKEQGEIEGQYYLRQLCKKEKICLAKILEIDKNEIKSKQKSKLKIRQSVFQGTNPNNLDNMQKQINQEIEQKQLIEIFKLTHENLENKDQKNSLSTFSKRAQYQDKLYLSMQENELHQIQSTIIRKKKLDLQKFIRPSKTPDQ